MNPITIFTGDQNTGKTATAKRISKEKETLWINSWNRDSFYDLSDKTELIIVDETDFYHDLKMIKSLIENDTIKYRKPYTDKLIEFQRPEIIICTNLKKEEIPVDILKRVTLREFFNHS